MRPDIVYCGVSAIICGVVECKDNGATYAGGCIGKNYGNGYGIYDNAKRIGGCTAAALWQDGNNVLAFVAIGYWRDEGVLRRGTEAVRSLPLEVVSIAVGGRCRVEVERIACADDSGSAGYGVLQDNGYICHASADIVVIICDGQRYGHYTCISTEDGIAGDGAREYTAGIAGGIDGVEHRGGNEREACIGYVYCSTRANDGGRHGIEYAHDRGARGGIAVIACYEERSGVIADVGAGIGYLCSSEVIDAYIGDTAVIERAIVYLCSGYGYVTCVIEVSTYGIAAQGCRRQVIDDGNGRGALRFVAIGIAYGEQYGVGSDIATVERDAGQVVDEESQRLAGIRAWRSRVVDGAGYDGGYAIGIEVDGEWRTTVGDWGDIIFDGYSRGASVLVIAYISHGEGGCALPDIGASIRLCGLSVDEISGYGAVIVAEVIYLIRQDAYRACCAKLNGDVLAASDGAYGIKYGNNGLAGSGVACWVGGNNLRYARSTDTITSVDSGALSVDSPVDNTAAVCACCYDGNELVILH